MQELAEKYEIADMVSLKASGEESEDAAEKEAEEETDSEKAAE